MREIFNYVPSYRVGLFIEAIDSTYEKLKQNLIKTIPFGTNYTAINSLVTSVKDKEYTFNIFNNDEASSSIYEPNMEKWQWAHVNVKDKKTLRSKTIEDILEKYNWKNTEYDLVIDVQGAELEVLRGFDKDSFKNIKRIEIEVSTVDFYKGGVLFDELNAFLVSNNFKLATPLTSNHCDVIYVPVTTPV